MGWRIPRPERRGELVPKPRLGTEQRHARLAEWRQAQQLEQRIAVLDLVLFALLDDRLPVVGADDDARPTMNLLTECLNAPLRLRQRGAHWPCERAMLMLGRIDEGNVQVR